MRAKGAKGQRRSSSHSVRTADSTWKRARERASKEGTTVNSVVEQILEGYGSYQIHLPEVKILRNFENSVTDKPVKPH